MANALFTAGKEGLLDDTISVGVATVKVVALAGYTFNAAHKFLSDVTGAGATVVSTSAALGSKTETGGAFKTANTTWSAVASGSTITSMILVQTSAASGGADVATTAQRVIGFYDTASGGAISVPTNGGDVNVTAPAAGWFAL